LADAHRRVPIVRQLYSASYLDPNRNRNTDIHSDLEQYANLHGDCHVDSYGDEHPKLPVAALPASSPSGFLTAYSREQPSGSRRRSVAQSGVTSYSWNRLSRAIVK
jgi:hypothetical protein